MNCIETPKYSERIKETKANAFHQDFAISQLMEEWRF